VLIGLLATIAVSASPAGAAQSLSTPQFVQGRAQVGSGMSLSVGYPNAVEGGSLLVGLFRTASGTAVSDNVNGPWIRAAAYGVNSLWYLPDAKAGATTVTVTGTTSGAMRADVAEYSGIATSSPLDGSSCKGTSSGSVATTGSTVPVETGELAFVGFGAYTNPLVVEAMSSAGVAGTVRNQLTGSLGTIADGDVVPTAAEAQEGKMTLSASADWAACIATFRPLAVPSAPQFVQGQARMIGKATSLSVAYPNAVEAGSLLTGIFRTSSGTTVSDNVNGPWARAGASGYHSLWYMPNAKPGATTVTVTGTTEGVVRADIAEYSGVATSSPLNGIACKGTSSSAVSTTGSTVPVEAGELAFIGFGAANTSLAVEAMSSDGVAGTVRNQLSGSPGTIADGDVVPTAAGAQEGRMTLSTSTTSAACIANFRSAATPAPQPALWSGDFETGDLSQWSLNQSCPGGVATVTSPVRSGRYAAKFTVSDSSTNANCPLVPTSDPRAQLVGPPMFTEGSDDYIGFSTYFPANFPTISSGWMQIAEIYGPPYGGSPSIGIDVTGNRLTLDRDPTHIWDTIWISPSEIPKGVGWENFVLHVKFSTDPSVGFVELWLNGVRQAFTNGAQRIYYDTLVPGVNWNGGSPNRLYLNQYRSATPLLGTVTLYHDAARVGSSYASVAP
jgi:hypothetical protein